ncbi:MAG: response regulator [Thermoguttaceae bacterium]
MIVRLLLVEDNRHDALLLRQSLETAYPGRYCIDHAATLGEARAMLAGNAFHAVLLNLEPPDSQGMHAVDALHAAAPSLPLVAMTRLDDEDLASDMIRRGVQDCLLKGQADAALVARSIRHAVERKRVEQRLRRLLGAMSGELRAPLNTIVGMTDLALSEELPARVRDYLQTAKESAGQLLEHLNEILDISRIATGRFELEQIPFRQEHPLDVQETVLPQQEGGNGQVASAEGKPAAIAQAAPTRPLRVLLAEDTPANQKLVLRILEKRGHKVEVAEDGRQAVDLLCRRRFDVVLADVQMPVMDGYQATGAIRMLRDAKKANVPIIAMTAHDLKSDQERCLAAGMDGYLSKPIDRGELIATVERWAANGRSAMEPRASDLKPAPFNIDEALARLGGQMGLFREMVAFFSSDGPAILTEIQAAFRTGDAAAIARSAHRLKGTALYLGAGPALEAIARVEAIGRSGDLAGAAEAIREMDAEMARLDEALRPYTP